MLADEMNNTEDAMATDPVARSRRATMRVAVSGSTLVVAAAVWALWPVGNAPITTGVGNSNPTTPSTPSHAVDASQNPLDLAAFDAPLWIHPPAPVVAKVEAPTPPPPPPLKAQLLAITSEGEGHHAIFYDEAKDALVTVGAGDDLLGRRVTTVDADGVTIEHQGRTQRLDLRPKRDRRQLAPTAAEDLAALMGRPWPATQTNDSSARPTPSAPTPNPTSTGVDP